MKKINRPIYVRGVDGTFNKKGPTEHIVKIFHKGYRKKTEIDVTGGQK